MAKTTIASTKVTSKPGSTTSKTGTKTKEPKPYIAPRTGPDASGLSAIMEKQERDRKAYLQNREMVQDMIDQQMYGTSDPYIQKLMKKNPGQEFSVFNKKTGKWETFNKGMTAGSPRPTPTTTTPVKVGIDPAPPGVFPGVAPTPTPVVAAPLTAAPVPDTAPVVGTVVGGGFLRPAPSAGVDASATAMGKKQGFAPVISAQSAVIPTNRVNKGSNKQSLNGLGARADLGTGFGTYSKKRDGSF